MICNYNAYNAHCKIKAMQAVSYLVNGFIHEEVQGRLHFGAV